MADGTMCVYVHKPTGLTLAVIAFDLYTLYTMGNDAAVAEVRSNTPTKGEFALSLKTFENVNYTPTKLQELETVIGLAQKVIGLARYRIQFTEKRGFYRQNT